MASKLAEDSCTLLYTGKAKLVQEYANFKLARYMYAEVFVIWKTMTSLLRPIYRLPIDLD